jgi:hypothetical protein
VTSTTVGENGYGVQIREAAEAWHVEIVDDAGAVVSERTCEDGSQARIFASTVRQHIYWLSAERFRQYYRI